MRLAEKNVLVTGAAGAIGSQVCRRLAGEGATVAAVDRLAGPLMSLKDELGIHVGVLDGSDARAMTDHVTALSDAVGPIDALVNVAGFFEIKDFVNTQRADWDLMIESNLYTAMAGCHAVLGGMLQRGSGSIVNFVSTAGEHGSIRPAAHYAAAKGAVVAFTKSLAREVSPQGVRVNCVSPGPIDTAMFQAGTDAGTAEGAARTLLGRMGRPDDVAMAVVYLVSDESAFVTGELLRVNGGALL